LVPPAARYTNAGNRIAPMNNRGGAIRYDIVNTPAAAIPAPETITIVQANQRSTSGIDDNPSSGRLKPHATPLEQAPSVYSASQQITVSGAMGRRRTAA
jgi:hypothetical protein